MTADMSMENIQSLGEDNIRILNGITADIVYDLAVQFPPAMVKFILVKAAMMIASGEGVQFIAAVYEARNQCGVTNVR